MLSFWFRPTPSLNQKQWWGGVLANLPNIKCAVYKCVPVFKRLFLSQSISRLFAPFPELSFLSTIYCLCLFNFLDDFVSDIVRANHDRNLWHFASREICLDYKMLNWDILQRLACSFCLFRSPSLATHDCSNILTLLLPPLGCKFASVIRSSRHKFHIF